MNRGFILRQTSTYFAKGQIKEQGEEDGAPYMEIRRWCSSQGRCAAAAWVGFQTSNVCIIRCLAGLLYRLLVRPFVFILYLYLLVGPLPTGRVSLLPLFIGLSLWPPLHHCSSSLPNTVAAWNTSQ
jgi:hypothetical protein